EACRRAISEADASGRNLTRRSPSGTSPSVLLGGTLSGADGSPLAPGRSSSPDASKRATATSARKTSGRRLLSAVMVHLRRSRRLAKLQEKGRLGKAYVTGASRNDAVGSSTSTSSSRRRSREKTLPNLLNDGDASPQRGASPQLPGTAVPCRCP